MKRSDSRSNQRAGQWAKEFGEFIDSSGVRPPVELTERVTRFVREDLTPGFWSVLSKFALVQAMIGGVSLMICSQFGIGPGQLSHVFMSFGETVCMALCGALFLGFGGIAAGFVLRSPEVQLIRQTGYAPVLVLGLLSLGIFLGFGAEIMLGLAFAWLLGGFIAGLIAIETTARLKQA